MEKFPSVMFCGFSIALTNSENNTITITEYVSRYPWLSLEVYNSLPITMAGRLQFELVFYVMWPSPTYVLAVGM